MIWVMEPLEASWGDPAGPNNNSSWLREKMERDIFFTARCYDYMACKIF